MENDIYSDLLQRDKLYREMINATSSLCLIAKMCIDYMANYININNSLIIMVDCK